MNTWTSLFWKEWREQRAVALAIFVVLLLVPLLTQLSDLKDLGFGIAATAMFATPLFAMFIAMGIASGEHARGTIHFLHALPHDTRKVGLVKLVMGLLSFLVPLALVVATYAAWESLGTSLLGIGSSVTWRDFIFNEVWGATNPHLSIFLGCALVAGSLYLWTLAVGANRQDEISAGAAAMLVIAACYLVFAIVVSLLIYYDMRPDSTFGSWFMSMLVCMPGAAAAMDGDFVNAGPHQQARYWVVLGLVIATHAALAWVFLKRYGRPDLSSQVLTPAAVGSSQAIEKKDWLAPPWRSPSRALIWKTLRELAPVAVAGLAVASVITLMTQIGSHRDWREEFLSIWAMIGGFVAVAVGIGTVREDLEPGLHTFWRSRPASADRWFWTKFAIGAALLLAIGFVAAWINARYMADRFATLNSTVQADSQESWNLNRGDQAVFHESWQRTYQYWSNGIGIILVHLGLYVGALLMMTLVRRPILAAVLAAGLLVGFVLLSEVAFRWIGPTDANGLLIGIPVVLLCLAAASMAAWQAFRHDWSFERWLG